MLAVETLDFIHWIFRWWHVVVGVAWIGLLYYFNFVQVPSFPTMEAPHRNGAIDKLVPRALWYFRWAAVATFITGVVMLGLNSSGDRKTYIGNYGLGIWSGALIGTVMLLNVWLVIWPNQQVVIANARGLLAGKEADPKAADAGRRALLASRTNAIFSIPMLMFMTGSGHLLNAFDGVSPAAIWLIVLVAIIAVLELNALGFIGGLQGPLTKQIAGHPRQVAHLAVPVSIILLIVWIVL